MDSDYYYLNTLKRKEMEEQKVKTPKMGVIRNEKKQDNQTGKLSYEQLNDACSQLYQQNQQLIKQVHQLNMANAFKRLDYLFMVLKYESSIKDAEFVGSCIEEIKAALSVPEEESAEKEG